MGTHRINEVLAQLVRSRLDELGENAFAAERRAGLPPDSIRSLLRPDRPASPNIMKAKDICDALGIEFHIGPRSTPPPPKEPVVAPAPADSQGGADDYIEIPVEQLGARAQTPAHAKRDAIAFQRAWLRHHRVDPLQSCLAYAPPDMAPLIAPGDLVLLRKNAPGIADMEFREDRIYGFRAYGNFHLRRIQQLGRTLVAFGHTSDVTPLLFNRGNAGLHVIGDVVWASRVVIRTVDETRE